MVTGIGHRPFPEYKLSISFHEKQSKRFFTKATAEKNADAKAEFFPDVQS
ncbi:hypothetical protein HMPREF7215_0609 [Pyramidobacter piscolens W5455]|uniref:Uncharacterized protein n=1 Tax=Pyramidobacter piscolens W5455 TaxID=352165 RepID=A0ABP2HUP4_9BACT|nr:hypothetical protein HMPREF7215_0609 [Pyramidobacter piscolens W5455]